MAWNERAISFSSVRPPHASSARSAIHCHSSCDMPWLARDCLNFSSVRATIATAAMPDCVPSTALFAAFQSIRNCFCSVR